MKWFAMGLLFVFGFGLRFFLCLRTFENPGDGPNRALISYLWHQHPVWIAGQCWLPGQFYLNSLALSLMPDPSMAVRLLNCFLGSLSPILLYVLVRKSFGFFPALLSAACLALLPLHIGLSASSLSEVSGLFFLLFSLALLVSSPRLLAGAIFALIAATTIRPEAWLVIPIVVAYVYVNSRSVKLAVVSLSALSTFPALWIYGCWMGLGQPLLSFAGGGDPRNNQVDFFSGLHTIFIYYMQHVGPVIFTAQILGALLLLRQLLKRELLGANRFLLLGIYLLQSLQLVLIACANGYNFQDRYSLNYVVFSLPMAGFAVAQIPWLKTRLAHERLSARVAGATLAIVLILNSLHISYMAVRPSVGITSWPWKAEDAFVRWYREGPFNGSDVILTSDSYRCFFIPLKIPYSAKCFVPAMDFWTPYFDLRDELRTRNPKILVLGDTDGGDFDYLLNVCDFKIDMEHPVFKSEQLRAYRILDGTFRVKEDSEIKPKPCFVYPETGLRTCFQPYRRQKPQVMLGY